MKSEEKSAKRFWRRGNILDIILLLLVLAAIVGIIYRYHEAKVADREPMIEAEVSFSVREVLPGIGETLRAGDTLRMGADNTVFGQLKKIEVTPAMVLAEDDNGQYVVVELPEGTRIDMAGTILCEGRKNENGAFVLNGETVLTPGETFAVYTDKAAFMLTVSGINVKNP